TAGPAATSRGAPRWDGRARGRSQDAGEVRQPEIRSRRGLVRQAAKERVLIQQPGRFVGRGRPQPKVLMRALTRCASSFSEYFGTKSSAPTRSTMAWLNTPDSEVCSSTNRLRRAGSRRISVVSV